MPKPVAKSAIKRVITKADVAAETPPEAPRAAPAPAPAVDAAPEAPPESTVRDAPEEEPLEARTLCFKSHPRTYGGWAHLMKRWGISAQRVVHYPSAPFYQWRIVCASAADAARATEGVRGCILMQKLDDTARATRGAAPVADKKRRRPTKPAEGSRKQPKTAA